MARKSIPDKVKLQIWTEAAGRCQFRGCNKPLWRNDLTLNKRNFGEMAHIIGASENGPRGGDESENLSIDADNIMLLCDRCHKEIDDTELKKLYSIELLKEMKKEYSDRVRLLLDQKAKKTTPLILTSQIGSQSLAFSDRSIKHAILPDYPDRISDDWFKIEIGTFDRSNDAEWEVATRNVDHVIDDVNRACLNGRISHLSIFGLAPQPLLMYLGRQIGDKITAQIFEPRRTDDQDKKWKWDDEDGNGVIFDTELIRIGESKNVILLLAISDFFNEDKYTEMLDGLDPQVYVIKVENPSQGLLKKRSEKALFIQTCRQLLNRIQNEVGQDCIIHVLPAVPASLAIEFGRLIQPTKDPEIWVYENVDGTQPKKIIELL